ncbi:rihA [Symbiodinium microadriaticum]|nr:rihA [Symbiodinium microadriaticum]
MARGWWLLSLAAFQEVSGADVGKASFVIAPDGGATHSSAARGQSLLRTESAERKGNRTEDKFVALLRSMAIWPPQSYSEANWKLALKVGETKTLGFSSPLWTNTDLLNEASAVDTIEDAKYKEFITEPFKRIRMCVGSPESNCVEHVFSTTYDSARALFSAGYIRDEKVDKDGILSSFGPPEGTYRDCPMQRPGFNIECRDGNKARWGFCANCKNQPCQNEDADDADAAIGIGIAGQATDTELGAGWSRFFTTGNRCGEAGKTFKPVWLWVDSLANWKLALKVGETKTLGFSSPLWTNTALLNEASAADTIEDAKYKEFITEPFKRIRMCVGSAESNCVEHVFSQKYESARALFSAGYIRDEKVDKDGILSSFGPVKGSYRDCPMQRPGFNIECKDGNKARWGFCANCPSQPCQNADSSDADAAIGIGIAGQKTDTELGAGWTAYFAPGDGKCSATSKTFKPVWLWVDSLVNWKLALKVGETSSLGFSSPLWTNTALLNEASPVGEMKDAKYSQFNTEPFKRIRMCVGSPESNCVTHVFSQRYDSAKALFSAGYIRDESVDKDGLLSSFGPVKGSYRDCPMQRPGFNIECRDGNKARWGFCANCKNQRCQSDDDDDADATIGIGLAGQGMDTELGAGWTKYFTSTSTSCNGGATSKSVWLWVPARQVEVHELCAQLEQIAVDSEQMAGQE